MASVNIDLRDYSGYIDRLGPRAISAMKRGILSGALRSIDLLIQRTRTAAPANPGGVGSGGAVDRACFVSSWKSDPTEDGVVVFNTAPHAAIVEEGRRPNSKFPPKAEIAGWIHRRLGIPLDDALAIAYVFARAIALRGLKGRHILSGSLDDIMRLVKEEIRTELTEELRK